MNPPAKAANRLPVKAPPKAKAAPIPDTRQPTMTTIGKSKQPLSERLGFNPDQVLNAFRAAQQLSAAMARGEHMSEEDLFRIAYDSIGGNNPASPEPEQAGEGGTASSSSGSAGPVQAAANTKAGAQMAEAAQVDEVRRVSMQPVPTVYEYHPDQAAEW